MSDGRGVVPHAWSNEFLGESPDGETWGLEVEHDAMKDGEPFTVTLDAAVQEADGTRSDTLICLSPGKAREVATALLVYAHLAERANERRADA